MHQPDPQTRLANAPLWRRFAAMFYDSLLIVALSMLVTAIYIGIRVLLGGSEATEQQLNSSHGDAFLTSLLFMVVFGFFAIFWTRSGQTLGMQAWSIRIQNEDGSMISLWQCLLRYLVAIPSLLLLGAGFFWAKFDKEGLTWHDRYSLSRVVLLPNTKRKK
ncbi:RDD family protein [Aestuariirhabdus litorea]|uniref:RDD family protein n=1 Tax=Aestuariirhabdus litorea TaxID=2528527 RepID=A0A3P3VSA2_9GAMM|nr:RDD family protein [Aestuariirhabdus litorea]RRJ85324.1 RDD family protein [Aestuariirhabdus litorea]RWW98546.1 RDD family protein [Endozoicomonadaceae bacterium GTF-13]